MNGTRKIGSALPEEQPRHFPSILAATLCCLLAVAESASAEPVWVAWVELRVTGAAGSTVSWSILGTHETKRECTEITERVLNDPGEGKVRQGQTLIETKGTSTGVYRMICLPDTMDPRGPKGK